MILSYRATIRACQKFGITARELNQALQRLIKATSTAAEAMRAYGIAVKKIKEEK